MIAATSSVVRSKAMDVQPTPGLSRKDSLRVAPPLSNTGLIRALVDVHLSQAQQPGEGAQDKKFRLGKGPSLIKTQTCLSQTDS